MAISQHGDIILPLNSQSLQRRPSIAVDVVALPLSETEVAVCNTLHVAPSEYLAMRAKRRSGRQPCSWAPDSSETSAGGPTSRVYSSGGFKAA